MSRLKQHLRNLRGSFGFTPSVIVAGSIVLGVSDDLLCRSGLEAKIDVLVASLITAVPGYLFLRLGSVGSKTPQPNGNAS